MAQSTLALKDLPYDCLHQVFSHMSYHEIAHYRLICRQTNGVCHSLLSTGAENLRLKIHRLQGKLKAQLPRRESARRGHMASDLLEIVNSVENRVSIIRLALDRYLVTGQLTFFPGKVLDEAYRIIIHIEKFLAPLPEGSPPRLPLTAMQKVSMLRDLRDLSTMASEHIDDIILPSLRNRSNVEPLVSNRTFTSHQRLSFCRSHDAVATTQSPAHSSSTVVNSPSTASDESSANGFVDPMMNICAFFFAQFGKLTSQMEELKNMQKQSQNKLNQLAAETTSLKQQLVQEQALSASLSKKVEVTETALADMRRITMNSNQNTHHVCAESSLKRARDDSNDATKSDNTDKTVNDKDNSKEGSKKAKYCSPVSRNAENNVPSVRRVTRAALHKT